jgi:hypothetical protein
MKFTTLMAAIAALILFVQSADARGDRHHQQKQQIQHRHQAASHHVSKVHVAASRGARRNRMQLNAGQAARESYAYASVSEVSYRGGLGGRPAAWCGWEMRQLVSSDPGPAFNLARNWARWGQAGAPGVGAVVVWPHHVGKIVGQADGMWVIKSGNDGHMVRTRPRSISGAIAIRWG